MKLTPLQKLIIQSIINLFETGTLRGDYSQITLLKGDSGGLTFGKSQTTLMSGNLFILVDDYCQAPNALFAAGLRPYLKRLRRRDSSLNLDWTLKQLLRKSGSDPVMRNVQDAFFDKVYWAPAVVAAERLGIQTPLGMAVVYDSFIHGSFQKIADRTNNDVGSVRMTTEKKWIAAYVRLRRAWLKSCPMPLPNTTYRQDTFSKLILAGNWDLELPFVAWGQSVSKQSLDMDSLGIATGDEDAWTLYLNDTKLGTTWQNPQDSYRNYFPARKLLEKLHGEAETEASLHFTGSALEWDNKAMSVPALLVSGEAWGQVRALAAASGLVVERDIETRTLRLTRNIVKAAPLPQEDK